MHRIFVDCVLSSERSVFFVKLKQTRAKMQKGWRGPAKPRWVRADRRRSDVVWQTGYTGNRRGSEARYDVSRIFRENESNRWIFISIYDAVYIVRERRCVRFSHCSHAIRGRMGNRALLVTRYQNSSRGSMKSFSSGSKRFHICNGSSNLCAFTEARPSTDTGISTSSSLFPIQFARTAPQTPSFRRSRSAIYFPRVGTQTAGASNGHQFEKESETQRTSPPLHIQLYVTN